LGDILKFDMAMWISIEYICR